MTLQFLFEDTTKTADLKLVNLYLTFHMQIHPHDIYRDRKKLDKLNNPSHFKAQVSRTVENLSERSRIIRAPPQWLSICNAFIMEK